MKYSIVIPTLGNKKKIYKLLDSIRIAEEKANLRISYEIILINDSGKKEDYSFKNAQIYFNKSNKGAGYSRNRGATLAKGRYIIFLDDDTLVLPYFFEEVEKILSLYNCDMLGGAVLPEKMNISSIFFTLMLSFSRNMNYLTTSNLIIKKNIFLKESFCEERFVIPTEDFYFFCTLKNKYNIYYTKKPLIVHEAINFFGLLKKMICYIRSHKRIRERFNKSIFSVSQQILSIGEPYLRKTYKKISILKKLGLISFLVVFSILGFILDVHTLIGYIRNLNKINNLIFLGGTHKNIKKNKNYQEYNKI
jgi:glycosyltransferase involved in cell wall biosynthesis